MKIKHVILENGDLMSGLPAGLHDHQLRTAVAQFATIKGGFNLYPSRGYKFCIGSGCHANVSDAASARNHKSTGSFELVLNKASKDVTTGNTRLAYRGSDDRTRVFVLFENDGRLTLEPYCSAVDARADANASGGVVVELRVSPNGQLVSAVRV